MQDEFLRYPIRGDRFSYSIRIKEHLLSRKTRYQQIDVYATDCFGKILTLDGHVQLASLDERAYHEALVHIPLMSLTKARTALVVGGGDGGVLRELCKWSSLERIDMVEIDGAVIEACQEMLPELSNGAFKDPRLRLTIGDALDFVAQIEEPYDFIVMDITDVYEGEEGALSEYLFGEKFHMDLRRALERSGLLVSQADNPIFCPYTLAGLQEKLGLYFAKVGSYQALVPSFGGFSAYCWAGHEKTLPADWAGCHGLDLTYLDEVTYRLAFHGLPFADMASHS